MGFEADKVMFEIYRDPNWSGKYCVVYFTELTDANRETEFNRALRGEHFFDGFLRNSRKETAKEIISSFLQRLNSGEKVGPGEVKEALKDYLA